MKRIVIFTSYMSGKGGVEKIIQRMYESIPADIYTISLTDGTYEEKGLIRCKSLSYDNWIPSGKGQYLRLKLFNRNLNTLLHFIWTFVFLSFKKVDYLVATGPMQVRYISKIIKILRKKTVLFAWPHFSKDSGFGDFNNFRYANKILCISRGIMQELQQLGVEEEKLINFPNPFYREDKTVNSIGNVFHYVGRLQFEGQKNIKELIDSLVLVKYPVVVNFIGDGSDLDTIKRYAAEKKVSDKVKFDAGWFDNPWSNVNCSRGLILTSKFEGLPTVIGEAMSLGIPVISSNCDTGPSDFIVPGVNGHLYTPGDTVSLARKLEDTYINGVKLDSDGIKNSINNFYLESYIDRFKSVFGVEGEGNE